MNTEITTVVARQVWDSRGHPTVEAEVRLADGSTGRAIAPAGASRGAHEAIDLRDGGTAFGGLGVKRAVANVAAEIGPALHGTDGRDQRLVDTILVALDGTSDRSRLGGNALVAVSMAVLHAAAASAGEPLWRYLSAGEPVRLPLPEIQIFGGGAHAGRRTDIQDFMVMTPHAGSFRRALEMTGDVYRAAGRLMEARGPLSGVADEGGWWPDFASNEDALDTLTRAIEAAGYRPGDEVFLSLDIAANELGEASGYRLALDERSLDGGRHGGAGDRLVPALSDRVRRGSRRAGRSADDGAGDGRGRRHRSGRGRRRARHPRRPRCRRPRPPPRATPRSSRSTRSAQ